MIKYYYLIIALFIFLGGCKEEPPVKPDTSIAPDVKIVWPPNGANVLDTTYLTIEATDDRGLEKIEIFIDNINYESLTMTMEPYIAIINAEYFDPSEPHTIIAKAYDLDQNVSSSEEISINTIQFQPTNLTATLTSDTSLTLRWRDNSNVEKGFHIEQKISNNTWTPLLTVDSNIVTVTVSGVFRTSEIYHYRVRSFNDNVNSSFSPEDTATITIPKPDNLKAIGVSKNSLRITWSDRCNFETGYRIERSVNGGAFNTVGEVNSNQSEYLVTNLDTINTYRFQIKTITSHNLSLSSESINTGYIFSGSVNRTLSGQMGVIKHGLFTPDDQYIITGGVDRNINIFDTQTGVLLRTILNEAPVNYIDISGDMTLLAVALEDGNVSILNFSDGSQVRTLVGHTKAVQSVKFNSTGSQLVSGSSDQKVIIWDVSDGSIVDSLIGHTGNVTRALFTPENQKIISADYNRMIKVWNVSDGSLISNLTGHTGVVYDIDISSDGTKLASVSNDRTVKIWNLNNNTLIKSMTGHTASVYTVKFSSTGQAVASAGADRRIRFWKSDNGTFLQTITYIPETIYFVSFNHSNTMMISGGTSRITTLWNVYYVWDMISN